VELQKDQREFKVGDEVIPLESARKVYGFDGVLGIAYTIINKEYDDVHGFYSYQLAAKSSHWVRAVDIIPASSLIKELL